MRKTKIVCTLGPATDNPEVLKDWDEELGDRMIKLVFIGRKMNKEQIISDLDKCLE